MQQTRLPLAAAPARAGTARAGRTTRLFRRPPLAQQERHRRHQPRGKHRARNDIPHHKHSLSAKCGTPRMMLPLRILRKPRHGVCSLPHRAETSPGRLHHSAPCGTLPGTMFAFPRHAERRPDDIHASAPCGNLAGAIFDFLHYAETSPRRFSPFRKTRKTPQVDFIVPYFEESRPERFSPFLTVRKVARNDFHRSLK